MRRNGNVHDQQLTTHPTSERVADLNQQIQEIAQSSAEYRKKPVRTQVDRSANQLRELRLLQIKEELTQMLKKPI